MMLRKLFPGLLLIVFLRQFNGQERILADCRPAATGPGALAKGGAGEGNRTLVCSLGSGGHRSSYKGLAAKRSPAACNELHTLGQPRKTPLGGGTCSVQLTPYDRDRPARWRTGAADCREKLFSLHRAQLK